jgi:putative FmdB family regulatory protein
MPIYEFYCKACHTVYQFFSRSVNTEKIPICPTCKNTELKRNLSKFATISSRKDEGSVETDMAQMDEAKMEKAMAMLAGEAEKISEDDPRQAAAVMRKLSEATGLNMESGMEEALSRLEQGEDPDKIEEEMGDLLGADEPQMLEARRKKGSGQPKPDIDETLYEL